MRKIAGRPAPQYLVYVGGGVRADRAEFGRLIGKVPARRAAATIERLLDFYITEGATGPAFWSSVPADRLRVLIADLEKLPDAEATEADFVDLGEAPRSRSRPARASAPADAPRAPRALRQRDVLTFGRVALTTMPTIPATTSTAPTTIAPDTGDSYGHIVPGCTAPARPW